MNHEARINEALKQLGEEHRLGMVQAEEYRSRRRMLIEAWHEKEVTTSPGSLRAAGFSTIPPGRKSVPSGPSGTPKLVLIGLAVLVAIAVSAWLTFAPSKSDTDAAAALPPPVALSEPVKAFSKAAADFILANTWDAGAIAAVLTQWRELSPEDRAVAREQPAVRTLRFRLDQNIQAESQLVAPDAPPEERQRLELLTRFAEELGA